MSSDRKIVVNFQDKGVRSRSRANVPGYFREWTSVDSHFFLRPLEWKKLPRRPSTLGYPPFDIFCDWIMDFATISAGQLERSDWQNYRKMLLLHFPQCPLFCWYCYNDAWEGCGVETDEMTAEKIVDDFLSYREQTLGIFGEEINILRISGGEPFMCPELVEDIAQEFKSKTEGNKAFLWVDTNLFPFGKENKANIISALKSLSELKEKVAFHACMHGAGSESFKRNTRSSIKENSIKEAIELILKHDLNLYLRINPIGLAPLEVESIYIMLSEIRGDLPLRTYLGPIELLYEHAIDRMKVFQGEEPFFSKTVRQLGGREPAIPQLMPINAAIYTWNKLLEKNFNSGYAKIPRHIKLKEYYDKKSISNNEDRDNVEWINTIILFKGWEKEIYALKMLESLSKPKGAKIELEYENKWVDPTFLSHAFSCPEFYQTNKTQVLILAAYKGGRTPKIVPLRWGTVSSIIITDCRNENHSLNLSIELGEYAYDLRSRIPYDQKISFFDYLTEYMGGGRIPFVTDTSYFCQYVGLQVLQEPIESLTTPEEASFKSIILDLSRGGYKKAQKDIYYRIKKIGTTKSDTNDEPIELEDGVLSVIEGQTVEFLLEACNPNLGNPGYPEVSQAEVRINTTETDNVKIAPSSIGLSKYGEQAVRIKFSRSGEYKGDLIFESGSSDARVASFRIPFKVGLRR